MDKKFSEFGEFRESVNSLKLELAHLEILSLTSVLLGAVVASWSLSQEVVTFA